MAIYELTKNEIRAVPKTTFGAVSIHERKDLQRVLRAHIEVISPETLVIAEEFSQWEDAGRRIDLLGIDRQANLVVIELKRTEAGGHMELQALRYAAMVSTMTFEQAVAARAKFQDQNQIKEDPEQEILDFLGWEEPNDDEFAQAVRIVLVSSDFSKELTTAVIWLNDYDLDIRCVRLKPYTFNDHILMDVQQVVPLPEAAEYQVKVREKTQKERKARESGIDFTRYDVSVHGKLHPAQWKRRAILLVTRALVDSGISPEKVSEVIHWRMNRNWVSVDGDVNGDLFRELAKKAAAVEGKTFDIRRWFCDDDELMHVNGRTYAFSNQWGNRTIEALELLAKKFPEYQITFTPTKASD